MCLFWHEWTRKRKPWSTCRETSFSEIVRLFNSTQDVRQTDRQIGRITTIGVHCTIVRSLVTGWTLVCNWEPPSNVCCCPPFHFCWCGVEHVVYNFNKKDSRPYYYYSSLLPPYLVCCARVPVVLVFCPVFFLVPPVVCVWNMICVSLTKFHPKGTQ